MYKYLSQTLTFIHTYIFSHSHGHHFVSTNYYLFLYDKTSVLIAFLLRDIISKITTKVMKMEQTKWIEKIKKIKKENHVLILAHYYVDEMVQEVADFVGDSYYLSQIALKQKQNTIVFCGVRFMGESAKILNPHKKIILVETSADCPMAHMVDVEKIKKTRKQYDDLAIVCYINSTPEVKALSDVCVTSSNAVTITKQLKQKNIFFIPDENLGRYVQSQVPEKNFIFNQGFCYVHKNINKDQVLQIKSNIPEAKVLVHPECTMDVLEIGDYIGSTSGIIRYVSESKEQKFIICTEQGILHELKKRNPDKEFFFVTPTSICSDMKKITLQKVYNAIQTLEPEITLDHHLQENAKNALEKMHLLAK